MNFDTLTRENLKVVRSELDRVLTLIELPDLAFRVGNISFSADLATIKLECATRKDGEVSTKEAAAFKVFAPMLGLAPTDLGQSFNYAGDILTITGYRPRAKKCICLHSETKHKNYVMPLDLVKAMLTVQRQKDAKN